MPHIPVTVEQASAATPALALATIAPINLPGVFTGLGPLPAVTGVRDQTGAWDAVGQSRTVELAGGSTAREELVEYTAPHSFAYRLTKITHPILGALASHIRGEWTMTPDGSGSIVRWTYSFYPKRGRHTLVRLGLAPLWRVYMRQTLGRAIAEAERRGASSAVRSTG